MARHSGDLGRFEPVLKTEDSISIRTMWEQGLNFEQIARQLECSQSTVRRRAKELGIVPKKAAILPRDELVALYSEGKSMTEIAQIFGCGGEHVAHELTRHGVALRGHKQAMELAGRQKKTARFKEDHSNWRGGKDSLPYSPLERSAHFWVRQHYGRANHCDFNPSHVSTRYDWSNISGNYTKLRSDWQMLCHSCHYWFDHPEINQEENDKLGDDARFAYSRGRKVHGKRKRTCGTVCHESKGSKCHCVCGGFFHGKAGEANREALHQATEEEAQRILAQHGFVKGKTAYLHQTKLPIPENAER